MMNIQPTKPRTVKKTVTPQNNTDKIGQLVRHELKRLADAGKIPAEEEEKLKNLEYCKKTFKISFPVLAVTPIAYERYWVNRLAINKTRYRMCSQWTERHRDYFNKWVLMIDKR
ncbi:MAG: hypothetical protein AB7E49_05595 [Campylobacterales bacterium]